MLDEAYGNDPRMRGYDRLHVRSMRGVPTAVCNVCHQQDPGGYVYDMQGSGQTGTRFQFYACTRCVFIAFANAEVTPKEKPAATEGLRTALRIARDALVNGVNSYEIDRVISYIDQELGKNA